MEEIIINKYNCLKELGLSEKTIAFFLEQKLSGYRYITNPKHLQSGRHIRWISLENPEAEIKINTGAIFCKMKDPDFLSEKIYLELKSYGKPPHYNSYYFSINFNSSLIFEKMTEDERIIAITMEYMNKKIN